MNSEKYRLFSLAAIVVASVLLVVFLYTTIFGSSASKTGEEDAPTHEVQRGPLTISFSEPGTIRARRQGTAALHRYCDGPLTWIA